MICQSGELLHGTTRMEDQLISWTCQLLKQVHNAPSVDRMEESDDATIIIKSIASIIRTCESQCERIIAVLSKVSDCGESNEEQSLHCDICDGKFLVMADLKKHQKIHKRVRKESFVCDICNRNFFTTARLDRHRRTHTGVKPFVCEQCGARYQQANDLVRHQKKHDGGSEGELAGFHCPEEGCGKILGTNHSLSIHMRIHTGEKPHTCPTCGKSFRTKSTASRHYVIHTGERKYCCEVCQKSFKTLGHLKQHRRVHRSSEVKMKKLNDLEVKINLSSNQNDRQNISPADHNEPQDENNPVEFPLPSPAPETDGSLAADFVPMQSGDPDPQNGTGFDKGFSAICDLSKSSDALIGGPDMDMPLKETIEIFIDSRSCVQSYSSGVFQLFPQNS